MEKVNQSENAGERWGFLVNIIFYLGLQDYNTSIEACFFFFVRPE